MLSAITSRQHLDDALASTVGIVFILRADGFTSCHHCAHHAADRLVAVHLDLVDGVRPIGPASRGWRTRMSSIISSQGQLVPAIRREGIVAIHRLLLNSPQPHGGGIRGRL